MYRIFSNCLYASAINQQNPFSEFKLIDKKLPPLPALSPFFYLSILAIILHSLRSIFPIP